MMDEDGKGNETGQPVQPASIQALVDKQVAAVAEAKRIRTTYENARDGFLRQLEVEGAGASLIENMRSMFDSSFQLGHTAGSSGESTIAFDRQLDFLQDEMSRQREERKARDEYDAAFGDALQRIAAAVERLPEIAEALDSIADYLLAEPDEEEDEEKPVPPPAGRRSR